MNVPLDGRQNQALELVTRAPFLRRATPPSPAPCSSLNPHQPPPANQGNKAVPSCTAAIWPPPRPPAASTRTPSAFKPAHNWPPDARKMWGGGVGVEGGVFYFGGHSSGLWRLEKNLPLEDWSGGHMTEAPCDVCYERQRRRRTGWRVNQNIWARCLLPSSQTSQSTWFTTPGAARSLSAHGRVYLLNDTSVFLCQS